MATEDTNPDEMWEAHRKDAFRTFKVHLIDLTVEIIWAHFWDNTSDSGHWNFYTIQPSGRKTITAAYGNNHVWKVIEVDDSRTDRAMVGMTQVEQAMKMVTRDPMKKTTKGVH